MQRSFRAIPIRALLPLALLALAGLPAPAWAHAGPPFPVIVDRPVGSYLTSVWTDPDIGTGTFFVILEPPKGQELTGQARVRLAVQPVAGRLPEKVYDALPQKVSYGQRHFAEVHFDRGEKWKVRVEIDGADGRGRLATEVEPTPDGVLGPMSMLLYAAPFVAVGFLWLKATLRKRPRKVAPAAG